MARGRRRECKCCRRLFRPDPRNRRHQRYCRAGTIRARGRLVYRCKDKGRYRTPPLDSNWSVVRARMPVPDDNAKSGSVVNYRRHLIDPTAISSDPSARWKLADFT
jgi:hypothetical protein